MLAAGEDNIEIYNQIIDLQKKLKQSEAERIRLEEMFDLLMKTLKEEEEMQLKSVENRYLAFLEDCARRNSRNEKILRSVERIESAANVLHAKSERLKMLRNYYEGYLERIIPSWKQPSLYYGPSQFSYHGLDWMRRRQFNSEEIPENIPLSFYSPNYEGSKSLRLNGCNDHSSVIESERKPFTRSPTNNWNNVNKNFWTQANKENLWSNTLGESHATQMKNGDLTLPSPVSNNKLHDQSNRFQCDYSEEEPDQKNKEFINAPEPSFSQKNLLENDWELIQNRLRQQQFSDLKKSNYSENSYFTPSDDPLNKTKKLISHSEGQEFRKEEIPSKRKDNSTREENTRVEKQLIVREPVEIKKPEFMVGKLHPDVAMTFEGLKKIAQHENLNEENLDNKIGSVTVPESVSIPCSHEEIRLFHSSHLENVETEPKNKLSPPKEKNNIENVKNALAENQIDLNENTLKIIKSIHNLSFNNSQPSSNPKVEQAEMEINDKSEDNNQSLKFPNDKEQRPESYKGQKIIFADENYDLKDDEKNELGAKENINESEGQFNNEVFQNGNLCDSAEEIYEDNEESYPESYFEQPPKSHFLTNIVSHVILEEDESEVNSNGTGTEIECSNQILRQENVEEDKCERAEENVNDINRQSEFNEPKTDDIQEVCDNPNLFENIISDEGNVGNDQMNFYADHYKNSFQEESTYENREMNDGGYLSIEENNHKTQEHHANNFFNEHLFEDGQSQEINNCNTQIIGERPVYQDQLSNENLEADPVLEHYASNDLSYGMQYSEQSNNNHRGVYYEQEEMNEEYFQNNLEQNNEFQENQERTENFFQPHIDQNQAYGEKNVGSRQSINNLAHLLESDSESFQMEHGSGIGNEDSDFDFSISQQQ